MTACAFLEVQRAGPAGVMFVSGGSGIARLVNIDNEQIKRLVYKVAELEKLADVIIVDVRTGIFCDVTFLWTFFGQCV